MHIKSDPIAAEEEEKNNRKNKVWFRFSVFLKQKKKKKI